MLPIPPARSNQQQAVDGRQYHCFSIAAATSYSIWINLSSEPVSVNELFLTPWQATERTYISIGAFSDINEELYFPAERESFTQNGHRESRELLDEQVPAPLPACLQIGRSPLLRYPKTDINSKEPFQQQKIPEEPFCVLKQTVRQSTKVKSAAQETNPVESALIPNHFDFHITSTRAPVLPPIYMTPFRFEPILEELSEIFPWV